MMTRTLLCAALIAAMGAGCGGAEKKVESEEIRERADDADRDLDRESAKQGEGE